MKRALVLLAATFAAACLSPLPLNEYDYSCRRDSDCGAGTCVDGTCMNTSTGGGSGRTGGGAGGGGGFSLGGGFGFGGGSIGTCSSANDCGTTDCCERISITGLCVAAGAPCTLGGTCNEGSRTCQ